MTELLWSGRERVQARASLRQAVHELQGALVLAAAGLLETQRDILALRPMGIWVDAWPLIHRAALEPAALDRCVAPLLEDLRNLDPAFDHWLAVAQETITLHARESGEQLLQACREPAESLRAAERLLRIDRGHEGAWRALIQAHADKGDRSAALAAFERCRAGLLECRQIEPSPETVALVAGIREPGPPEGHPVAAMPILPQ
ncbi:MAG: hypothetical protein M3Y41_21375, partial [Pseudomonadota bacterium]|nr:hypothetical protein [Pseudomonadota bacterium]